MKKKKSKNNYINSKFDGKIKNALKTSLKATQILENKA